MSTVDQTAENNQTWRVHAEQLIPEQIAEFEDMEAKAADHPRARVALLEYARDYAERNAVDAAYANVPLPDGAQTDSESWGRSTGGEWSRSLVWLTIDTGLNGVDLCIEGRQKTDGSYNCEIGLYAEDLKLTAKDAIRLSAALLTAANERKRIAH
ncbi:MAG: hypothetical protein HYZ39_22330 [Mycolicibacterium cosmeticum]|nr:hypothetical protein [Mycolicibacterium cosmeticum]